MSEILCVTNKALCKSDFFIRIEEIAKSLVAGIILREKELAEDEYKLLAKTVLSICDKYNVMCILHSFVEVAIELNVANIHLTMPKLRSMSDTQKAKFKVIGASCHSVEEAMEAERLGCTYIIVGHIFSTECKKDLEPRGIEILKNICKSVSIPIYAIGGINSENVESILEAGAKGACVMSGLMQCENVEFYLKEYKKEGIDYEV